MKLFTVGPVEMYPETLEIASSQLPYFRTEEFSQLMLENEVMFRETIGAMDDSKTVFLTASGTGAMEATLMNCFTHNDKLLIVQGGSFGKRFAEIAAIHGIPYKEIVVEFEDRLTSEDLERYDGEDYTALVVNIHETSTGQLYDMTLLSDFCKRNKMYLVVDAIGSYGADEVKAYKYGIDALIVSSQKALALSPGISIVNISNRLYEERVKNIASGSLYFDFKTYIDNQKRGQTPFTPAVGVMLELHERLEYICKIGIEEMNGSMKQLADYFRKLLKEADFQVPAYPLSNALTPVMLEPNAKRMYDALKNEYGLFVTPCGGQLENVLIRVGHLGNVVKEDYGALADAMIKVREKL